MGRRSAPWVDCFLREMSVSDTEWLRPAVREFLWAAASEAGRPPNLCDHRHFLVFLRENVNHYELFGPHFPRAAGDQVHIGTKDLGLLNPGCPLFLLIISLCFFGCLNIEVTIIYEFIYKCQDEISLFMKILKLRD